MEPKWRRKGFFFVLKRNLVYDTIHAAEIREKIRFREQSFDAEILMEKEITEK